ncbi:MAG: energy transducer TonB, partial [Halothiobacillaceae bacterium]
SKPEPEPEPEPESEPKPEPKPEPEPEPELEEQPDIEQPSDQAPDTQAAAEPVSARSSEVDPAPPSRPDEPASPESVAGNDPAAENRYAEQVRAAVERCKEYPRLARRLREEGTVVMRFTLARDGSLLQVEMAASSGRDRLDKAARQAIECMDAPPFERSMRGARRQFELPIEFRLY